MINDEISAYIPELYPHWDKFVLVTSIISENLRKRFGRDIRIVPGYLDSSGFKLAGIGSLDNYFVKLRKLWFAVDDRSDEVEIYLKNTFGLKLDDRTYIYESYYIFYIDFDDFNDLYMICKMMRDKF